MGLIRHSDFIYLILKGLVWLNFLITDNQNTHTIGSAYSSHIAEFQNHKNTCNFLVYSFPIFLHTCISYQRAAGSLPFSLWSFWLTLQRGLTPSGIEKEDKIHFCIGLILPWPSTGIKARFGGTKEALWIFSKETEELAQGPSRNLWQNRECQLLP